jgi:hypothetical protein
MKFLVVFLIAKFFIAIIDDKKKDKKIDIERNDVKDPASFRVR